LGPRGRLGLIAQIPASQVHANLIKPVGRVDLILGKRLSPERPDIVMFVEKLKGALQIWSIQHVVVVDVHDDGGLRLVKTAEAGVREPHAIFPDDAPVRMPGEIKVLGQLFVAGVVYDEQFPVTSGKRLCTQAREHTPDMISARVVRAHDG
jgi:hypothetical protein